MLLLQRPVADIGEDQMSVRTKFMIETIHSLKNNRLKTGAAASAVAAEHTTRMKKALGSLNNSRSIKAAEPLRITLADIRESEQKGKWWLVGASYHDPAKLANNHHDQHTNRSRHEDLDADYESDSPGSVNLSKLAREQGMNTDVRRAIFIATLSAIDYQDAHMRILKLHLKAKQMLEIPRVLVHCAGAEDSYNPFYALVARKFCGEHRLRKAFQFTFWDVLRRLEADGNEEDEQEKMTIRKLVNFAKFYGSLIADGSLRIAVLKKLEFAYLSPNTSMFVEVLLSTIFTQIRKKHAPSSTDFEQAVKDVFVEAARAAQIIPGLRHVIETSVARAELAQGKKERRAIERGCEIAVEALDEAARSAPVADLQEDEEEA